MEIQIPAECLETCLTIESDFFVRRVRPAGDEEVPAIAADFSVTSGGSIVRDCWSPSPFAVASTVDGCSYLLNRVISCGRFLRLGLSRTASWHTYVAKAIVSFAAYVNSPATVYDSNNRFHCNGFTSDYNVAFTMRTYESNKILR